MYSRDITILHCTLEAAVIDQMCCDGGILGVPLLSKPMFIDIEGCLASSLEEYTNELMLRAMAKTLLRVSVIDSTIPCPIQSILVIYYT